MAAAKTTETSDTDLAAFMIVYGGLVFLTAEYAQPRSTFVLSDPGGHADSLRRQFIGAVDLRWTAVDLRRFLAVRRGLINALDLAKAAPSRTCSAADLAEAGAAAAARAAERRNRVATG